MVCSREGSVATDALFATVETELNIEAGTLRTLSGLTRADVADAMQSVGIDHRLEDLVRNATQEELQDLSPTRCPWTATPRSRH